MSTDIGLLLRENLTPIGFGHQEYLYRFLFSLFINLEGTINYFISTNNFWKKKLYRFGSQCRPFFY